MIVVRDVFQLKFGKSREAREVWAQGKPIVKRLGPATARTLTDCTGPYYTFVLETTHESLSAYEKHIQSVFGDNEWQQWYAKLTPLVESGRREIFNVAE
ncbi:MAG TPA: hypothetical protein VMS93_04090 [Candidatus Saccharimonadales bacterium]|nr:hypothetical protein [Candidatus Saccharimonadales bacterium]